MEKPQITDRERRDVTIRKCSLCGHKERGRIDMYGHLMDDHTQKERLEALHENADPGPNLYGSP